MEKHVKVRAYNKVWKMDNRIYAINNLILPVPVSLRDGGYFLAIAGVMFALQMLIPFVRYIPSIIRFMLIPFALTQFLLKKKLDGKPPLKYLFAWIKYITSKNEYIERFAAHTNRRTEKIRIEWFCSQGCSMKSSALDAEGVEAAEIAGAAPAPAPRSGEPRVMIEASTRVAELVAEITEPTSMAQTADATAAREAGKTAGRTLGQWSGVTGESKRSKGLRCPVKSNTRNAHEKNVNIEKMLSKVLLGVVVVVFAAVMVLSVLK